MIYLTNDTCGQAIYLDLRKSEKRHKSGATEHLYHGLLGNGVNEISLTVKSWRDCVEMVFGKGALFSFVDERTIRRILNEVVHDLALQ